MKRRRDRRPPSPGPTFILEPWLTRHRRWILLVIVAASLAIRGVYVRQLVSDPSLDLHRWDQSDMHYFDAWGRQIAHGDWLSATVAVPMHDWHHQVAEQYLTDHPDVRVALTAQATQLKNGTDAHALLWSQWMHGRQFYQDPLYPYLIGLTYRLLGDDVRFVFAWQMVLGVMSNVLIWLLARRCFGDAVAACAALIAVLCGPLVYYELILLREATIIFTGLAVVWLADRTLTGNRWTSFALLGLSLGLAFLLKSSFALLIVGVGIAIVVRCGVNGRRLLASLAATAAGLAIALTPLAIRNLSLGLPPLALASSGGLTFVIANHVGYNPSSGFDIDVVRTADLLGASGGGLLPAVRATLAPHTIASAATLLWGKWDRAWHWFEVPNNDNFYYMRTRAPVLAWLPVTFWPCAALALVGLVLGARRFKDAWPLYLLVICSLVPLLVFYVLARFRVPLTAAAIPFAALTLVEVARWMNQRRYRRGVTAAAAILVLVAWTGRPVAGDQTIRAVDWLIPFRVRFEPEVRAALDAHDPARAASALLEYFRDEPDPEQLWSADPAVFLMLGRMHADCALYLRDSGQAAQAREQTDRARPLLRSALAAEPSNVQAHGLLADMSFEDRLFADAAEHYTAYLRLRPNAADALSRLGLSLVALGRPDEALDVFRRSVAANPKSGQAQQNLANALLGTGRVEEAVGHAEMAAALRPDDPAVHHLLGRIWAAQGKSEAAAAEFRKALSTAP